MNSGLASLHKILKDETRRKIVLLLNEKGSLSYTDLMKTLEIDNTGRMNYHLKILDDLFLKKEDGQYALTEKGKLASRLLLEFPEKNRKQLGMAPKWWRKFWIGTTFLATVLLIVLLVEYFIGHIDLTAMYHRVILIIGAIGIAYMIQHITRDVLSKKTQLTLNKIAYTALGAWLGLATSFLAVVLLSLFSLHIGGFSIATLINNTFEVILLIGVPIIIGGIIGYRFGKSRGFKRPEMK